MVNSDELETKRFSMYILTAIVTGKLLVYPKSVIYIFLHSLFAIRNETLILPHYLSI